MWDEIELVVEIIKKIKKKEENDKAIVSTNLHQK